MNRQVLEDMIEDMVKLVETRLLVRGVIHRGVVGFLVAGAFKTSDAKHKRALYVYRVFTYHFFPSYCAKGVGYPHKLVAQTQIYDSSVSAFRRIMGSIALKEKLPLDQLGGGIPRMGVRVPETWFTSADEMVIMMCTGQEKGSESDQYIAIPASSPDVLIHLGRIAGMLYESCQLNKIVSLTDITPEFKLYARLERFIEEKSKKCRT